MADFNTDNENFIKANIAGDGTVCISSNAIYTAQVFGPPGDYSYSWQISPDGVNYGNVLETSTIFYWSFQDIGDYYIRLTISVGSQTAYFYFIVKVVSFDDPFCSNHNRPHLIDDIQSASLHQDMQSNNLRIYPNPVYQKLNVTLNKLPLQGKFIIANSIGQVLRDINLDNIDSSLILLK